MPAWDLSSANGVAVGQPVGVNPIKVTFTCWVKFLSLVAGDGIYMQADLESEPDQGHFFCGLDSTTSSRLRFFIDVGKTACEAVSATGTVTTGTWYYIAFSGHASVSGPYIFLGTLTSAATEVSYALQTAGGTQRRDDGGFAGQLGLPLSGTGSSQIELAHAAIYYNTLWTTAAQAKARQFYSHQAFGEDAYGLWLPGLYGATALPNLGKAGPSCNGTVGVTATVKAGPAWPGPMIWWNPMGRCGG